MLLCYRAMLLSNQLVPNSTHFCEYSAAMTEQQWEERKKEREENEEGTGLHKHQMSEPAQFPPHALSFPCKPPPKTPEEKSKPVFS